MAVEASLAYAVAIGLGATVVIDLWALFLARAFKVPAFDYCLVGRWLRYMPGGIFRHANILVAPRREGECALGWLAHYVLGGVFGVVFVALASEGWLARPALLPALLFGIGTVLVPYLVMQPALGFGIAASKMPNPARARLRSLAIHAVFGFGLYACAVAVSGLTGRG